MAGSGKAGKGKARKKEVKGKDLPASVLIGPYRYKIIYGQIGEGKNWGNVSGNSQTIWLDNSGPASRTSVVLIHEICHAIV